MDFLKNRITDVPGIRVGHASDFDAMTGCTAILCPDGAVGSVDLRGAATGTRQIDALFHRHSVPYVNAVMISGGSAFGLDAAGGALKYLEEQGIGFDVTITRVPIVPTAIIFDLGFGRHDVRPGVDMGYKACRNAHMDVPRGSIGAGTGATIGKFFGLAQAMKGGIGTSSIFVPPDIVVGALAVVNAFGDIRDPGSGSIIAGARTAPESHEFADTNGCLLSGLKRQSFSIVSNTTIGVVATNASLTKATASSVARMAQNGLVRTLSPAHTLFDGDIVFALSVGDQEADINAVGVAAETALSRAVLDAVFSSHGMGLLPAYRDLRPGSNLHRTDS
jgi:L-aminopeptidase/D-esterase-like protein